MMQAEVPDNFVLASGRSETVRDFARMAFEAAGIEQEFQGQGQDEVAIDTASGATRIQVSPAFYRPAEVDLLVGDASKAKQLLGWRAETGLEALCAMMVEADLDRLKGKG